MNSLFVLLSINNGNQFQTVGESVWYNFAKKLDDQWSANEFRWSRGGYSSNQNKPYSLATNEIVFIVRAYVHYKCAASTFVDSHTTANTVANESSSDYNDAIVYPNAQKSPLVLYPHSIDSVITHSGWSPEDSGEYLLSVKLN